MRPRLAAVLYDHDGTLIDSLPVVVAATNQVLADLGLAPLPAPEVIAGMVLPTGPRLGGIVGSDDPARQRELALAFYRAAHAHAHRARCYAGVAEVLTAAADVGLAQGVVSNNEGRLVRRLLAGCGLDRHLQLMWGEEDVPAPKPDPAGLMQACARLGVPPQACVYVGDGAGDVPAAHAAGMPILGVTWGIHPREEMAAMGFDELCDSAASLRAAITAAASP